MPVTFSELTSSINNINASNSVLNDKAILDPVGKLRVANPETLIDTDFEYGLQTTKWETLETVNNIPTFYARDNDEALGVSDIVIALNSFNITVTTAEPHGLNIGTPLIISGVRSFSAEGAFVVNQVVSDTSFVYNAKQKQVSSGSIFDAYSTTVYIGRMYQGTQYNLDALGYIKTNGLQDIQVDTRYPHGFTEGTSFILSRSVGQKQLNATGSAVDPRELLSYAPAIDTVAFNGQRDADTSQEANNLTVHEWESTKTVLFSASAVVADTNAITIPNHGLSSDDYVMYAPAPVTCTGVEASMDAALTARAVETDVTKFRTAAYVPHTLDGANGTSINTGGTGAGAIFVGGANNVISVEMNNYANNICPLFVNSNGIGGDYTGDDAIFYLNANNYPGSGNQGANFRYVSLRHLRGTYRNQSTTTAKQVRIHVYTSNGEMVIWTSAVIPANDATLYTLPTGDYEIGSGYFYVYYVRVVTLSGQNLGSTFQGVNGTIKIGYNPISAPLPYATPTYTTQPAVRTDVDYKFIGNEGVMPHTFVLRMPSSLTAYVTFVHENVVASSLASAAATHERAGMYNTQGTGSIMSTWTYWGVYGVTTQASVYSLVINMNMSAGYTWPTLAYNYTTPTAMRSCIATNMSVGSQPGAPYTGGCYMLHLLQTRAAGARITQAEMSTVVNNVMNKFACFTGLFDQFNLVRSLNYAHGTGDGYSQGAPVFVDGNRVSVDGIPLLHDRRYFQVCSHKNVRYRTCGTVTSPHMFVLRIRNNQTATIRIQDPNTGSTSGTRFYNTTTINTWDGVRYGRLAWWGMHSNSSGKPSIYHVLFTWTTNAYAYPSISNTAASSTGEYASMDYSFKITPNTATDMFAIKLLLSRPSGGSISDADIYQVCYTIMNMDRRSSSTIADGTDSLTTEQNAAIMYNSVSGLSPYSLYRINVLDTNRIQLRDVPSRDISVAATHAAVSNGSYGSVTWFNYDLAVTPFAARIIDFPSMPTSSYLHDYNSGRGNYFQIYVVDTDGNQYYAGDMNWGWNAQPQYIRDWIPVLVLPTTLTIKALRFYRWTWEGYTNYCRIYVGANDLRYVPTFSLGTVRSLSVTDTRAVSHKHALLKAYPVSFSINNLAYIDRKNTDPLQPVNADPMWVFGPGVTNVVSSTDNITLLNYRRYTLNNIVVKSDSTSFNILYNGSTQGLARNYLPPSSWVVFGKDLPYRNSLFVPKHGLIENTEIRVQPSAGSLGSADITSGRTYYASIIDANNVRLKDSVTDTTADFTMTDGTLSLTYSIPNPAANSVTIVNHGLQEGAEIQYIAADGAVVIPGLTSDTTYYANNVTDDRFCMSASSGSGLATSLKTSLSYTMSTANIQIETAGGTLYATPTQSTTSQYLLKQNPIYSTGQCDDTKFTTTFTSLFGAFFLDGTMKYTIEWIFTDGTNTLDSLFSKATTGGALYRFKVYDPTGVVAYTSDSSLRHWTFSSAMDYASIGSRSYLSANDGVWGVTVSGDLDGATPPCLSGGTSWGIQNTASSDGSSYGLWNNSSSMTSGSVQAYIYSIAGSPSAIDITSAPTASGVHNFFVRAMGATDGTYVVTGANPASTVMTLRAPFNVPLKKILLNPAKLVNLTHNTLYMPMHRMTTGANLTYTMDAAGTVVGGLEDGREYFAVVVDVDHVRLADTYDNARSGTVVVMTSVGTGTAHVLTDSSVGGDVLSPNTVTIAAGSSMVTGAVNSMTKESYTRFLSEFKVGNTFAVVVPDTRTTDYTISSVDNASFTLTINKAANFATGDVLIYAPAIPNVSGTGENLGSITQLTKNAIYYARLVTSTTIKLYLSRATAIANTGAVQVTSTSPLGVLSTNYPATIFRSKVLSLRSNNVMDLDTALPVAVTSCKYIVSTNMIVKADGFSLHRPYDGGVEMIPATNSDSQMIRQTRKYFRYQSGKGIQVSMAINFSAPVTLDGLYRDAGTGVCSGVTRRPHRMVTGVAVTFANSSDATWNQSVVVASTPTANTFTFTTASTPVTLIAPGIVDMTVNTWLNSTLRCGMFDDQNGLFFEYTGSVLNAVRRSSVRQLPGTATMTFNSPVVVGLGTGFTSQVSVRQRIVIKGQTYKVVSIASDNLLYIQPVYRGISKAGCIVTRTEEERIPQYAWDDPCDGTGASGYNLDIHKIQMSYMDYSWYGAGKVRFGFRLTDGSISYIHTLVHNNKMTEAYLRSGNLPCRYEVENIGAPSYTPGLMHWGTSVIMDGRFDDDKSYLFTGAGQVISYTGVSTLTIYNTRSVDYVLSGKPYNHRMYIYDTSTSTYRFAYVITAPVASYASVQNVRSGSVITGTGIPAGTKTISQPQRYTASDMFIYIDKAPTLSFSGGTFTVGNEVGEDIPKTIPLVSIRLAPSVDNSLPGPLGSREILNRMQLSLRDIGILASHDVEVKLLLNGFINNKTWQRVTSPSLSQLVYHAKGDTVDGGTVIFSFRASGGAMDSSGKRAPNSSTFNISDLITLGNSILGGDGIYPDGPDLLTICVSIMDTAGIALATPFTSTARVTWSESQA